MPLKIGSILAFYRKGFFKLLFYAWEPYVKEDEDHLLAFCRLYLLKTLFHFKI